MALLAQHATRVTLDLVVHAQTGSGKTYAYAIPMLQQVLRRQDTAGSKSNALRASQARRRASKCSKCLRDF